MITTKRKILLERYRSRKTPFVAPDSVVKIPKGKCKDCGEDEINMQDGYTLDYGWGTITANTIPVRIFITQNVDDMGMFKDISYFDTTPDYSELYIRSGLTISSISTSPEQVVANKLNVFGLTKASLPQLRHSDKQLNDYYSIIPQGSTIIGYTDDKIDDVTSIKLTLKYSVGKNRSDDPKNYWSGIVNINSDKTILNYKLNATNSQSNLELADPLRTPVGGSWLANTGIDYITDKNIFRTVNVGKCYGCQGGIFSNRTKEIFSTRMEYPIKGWISSNTRLSAITKNEMFFGITSPQEVMSDVFIERGVSSPMEHHLRLNDVAGVEEFSRYGNKFYNIKT